MPRYRVAQLILADHPLHGKPVDVIHEPGLPLKLEPAGSAEWTPSAGDRDLGSAVAFAGWWDLQCDFREPGTERAEGITHGLSVAAAGGFAMVAPVASTSPCRDQPSAIRALKGTGAGAVTGILPVATLSMERAGILLTEGRAMLAAGAVAFSDDGPIQRAELLRRGLEYHQSLGTRIFSDAHDPSFQPEGLMHEGMTSTQMGVPGWSEETETMRIKRDLDILRYTGGRLHFPVVTSEAGLEAIRMAKAEGWDVTCGTTVHHLLWTEADLAGFNSTLKLTPPLRTAKDRTALREAALDGTLDVVISDHRPRTPEEHDVDFMVVRPGLAALHAAGAGLMGALLDHGADQQTCLDAMACLLSSGPRRVLGAPASECHSLDQGLTLFSVDGQLDASPSKAPNAWLPDAPWSGQPLGVLTPRGAHWN